MEASLIKWASAIENLLQENENFGWRPLPTYKNHLAKNVPILRDGESADSIADPGTGSLSLFESRSLQVEV